MKTLAIALLALGLTMPAWAQNKPAHGHGAHAGHGAAPTAAAAVLADGEVRKIDAAAARITLKHGEIKALDMPPMTMVYAVRDKALLGSVKVGDKVKFRAVNESGSYVVTELQRVAP